MTTNLTGLRGPSRAESAPGRKPRARCSSPPSVQPFRLGGRRQLYGGFGDLGVSLDWYDFELAESLDWSRCFHPGSLVMCLNLAGQGVVHGGAAGMSFKPLTAGFFLPGPGAVREAGQRHRFAALAFSVAYLRQHLAGCDGALHPLVEAFLREDACSGRVGEVHRLRTEQEQWLAQWVQPPVFQRARPLWYHSQVLQLMVEFFFERPGEDELLCDRQKRLARERCARVRALLRERLAEPPSLEEIGRAVGCSPFYLSRIFSQETGTTIPQCLRKLRMERAAELLQAGTHNVTEAALEVGYSSLSHFSQAFCQTMGYCPGMYPLKVRS